MSSDGEPASSNLMNYDPEQLPSENSSFLERAFICRFRCLLDNSSGFLVRLRFQLTAALRIKCSRHCVQQINAVILEPLYRVKAKKIPQIALLKSHWNMGAFPVDEITSFEAGGVVGAAGSMACHLRLPQGSEATVYSRNPP